MASFSVSEDPGVPWSSEGLLPVMSGLEGLGRAVGGWAGAFLVIAKGPGKLSLHCPAHLYSDALRL